LVFERSGKGFSEGENGGETEAGAINMFDGALKEALTEYMTATTNNQ
jgi:hypothetical protein